MAATYKLTPVYDEDSFHEIQDAADVAKVVLAGARAFEDVGVLDAEETLVFARQLESVRNKVYMKKFPEYIARTLLPIVYEDPLAEFVTMRVWTEYGTAKIVSDYSTDFPRVTRSAVEYFVKPYELGNAYGYNLKELRRAAKAGVSLKEADALLARREIEMGIEDAICVGVPSLRTFGLTNHPNVSLLSLTNGDWTNASRTAAEILDDLNQIVTTMWSNTLEIFRPDTLVMSSAAFRLISTKIFDATSGRTVLEMFRAQNPGVTVKSWTKLATANAAGTNGRMIAYKNDVEVLEMIMGTDFEVLPAEQTGMDFEHKCYATVFGVQIHHPLAIFAIDNQLV